MGTDFDEDHRGAPPESWAGPFRKALDLRGRPDSKLKWYLIWARRFATWLAGRSLHLATHDDAEGFLTTLASSPGVAPWQVEQATDALTILLGSVFGQEWGAHRRVVYAYWVNRFLAFCRDGGIERNADSVRAFLERLVMALVEQSGYREARWLPHAAALLRHPPA